MFHHQLDPKLFSRRSFLGRCTGAAFGASIFNTLTDLRLIQSAAAQGAFTDYKALICVFLSGGNDSNNFLLPYDGQPLLDYQTGRSTLALASSLPLSYPTNPYGYNFGIHPSCPELQSLFASGDAAFLCNVGTLVEPISKQQYKDGTKKKPPQLFSHNDQVVQWQTSIPDQISQTGWGGRSADLIHAINTAQISMSISLAGQNTFEVGDIVHPYQVTPVATGPVATSIKNSSGDSSTRVAARMQAIRDILNHGRTNLYEKDYGALMMRALDGADQLNTAITQADVGAGGSTPLSSFAAFPTSSLGNQMKTVARIINARNALGFKRQIFFCSIGGFDTHNNQLAVGGGQAGLLQQISQALGAFQTTMGTMGVNDSVTSFTASDFGRTFPVNNGLGSDHGWGSHQIIVGGAVSGQKLYGTFPNLLVSGPDDVGTGRWIPTTSVDQFGATLAKWFGVTDANLDLVFPNLNRFASRNLGFL